MKLFVVFAFAVAAASAFRSGPYLPSGWKPKGPAFLLPTEEEKPEDPPKEALKLESEASGSDFLREYGPPDSNDINQSVTVQDLPDIYTEKAFAELQVNNEIEANITEGVEQVRSNLIESAEDKVVGNVIEDKIEAITAKLEYITVQDKVTDSELSDEETTPLVREVTSNDVEFDVITETASISEDASSVTDFVGTYQTTEIPLNNEDSASLVVLPEELNAEVRSEEINTTELSEEEGSGVAKEVSEAEIGFREYGPPKDANNYVEEKIEANETRRRRFSSKFVS